MKPYSQAGQDEWVHSIIGDSGYFVDVGAHDGIVHSNTYALEQLGWDGVCVEPNPDAFEQLASNRSRFVSNFAISDHDGLVPFDGVCVGTGSGIPCRTLSALLEFAAAPPVIDYLSIDVEGHECAVLAGMDFDRWKVRLMTVEHNAYLRGSGHKDLIYSFLTARGFERVVEDVVAPGYGIFEDWYQHT